MKWILILLPLIWTAQAASLAAAEGDCADCNAALIADTGVGAGNMQIMDGVSRVVASATPTKVEQNIFCRDFIDSNLSGLKEKVREFGYELHDIYKKVTCDDQTNSDLLRHRTRISTAGGDLMSFARYYIREHNDPKGLTEIFNRVIDNPGKPRGTLLDFIDYYSSNPNLSAMDKDNFAAYESTIKRFGGKRESEL